MIHSAQRLLALLGRLGSLGLFGAPQLLRTVLALLAQLPRSLGGWGHHAGPNQSVLRLELSLRCLIIVNEREACAPSTTKVRPESEGDHALLARLVHRREGLRDLGLGDIRARGVEHIHDELTARQQAVRDEFARADGDGC